MVIRNTVLGLLMIFASAASMEAQCDGYCFGAEQSACEQAFGGGSEVCHYRAGQSNVSDRGTDWHYPWSPTLEIAPGYCFFNHATCGELPNDVERSVVQAALRARNTETLREVLAKHQGAWWEIDVTRSAIQMVARCDPAAGAQLLAEYYVPSWQLGYFVPLFMPMFGAMTTVTGVIP